MQLAAVFSNWLLDLDVPPFTSERDKRHPFVRELSEMKRSLTKLDTALDQEQQRIEEWLDEVNSQLGEGWNKDELARSLLEELERLPAADVAARNRAQAREAVRQFQKESVTEALNASKSLLLPNVDRSARLATIGRDFGRVHGSTLEVIRIVGELVENVETRLKDKLAAAGNPISEALGHFEEALANLESALAELES